MSILEVLQKRSKEADKEWGRRLRKRDEEAGKRLQDRIAKSDALMAESAGMTPEEFQQLIEDEGRITATGIAVIMRNSRDIELPCSLIEARKSYEYLHPDTARKDTGVEYD